MNLDSFQWRLRVYNSLNLSLRLIFRPMVSRPVCLGTKHRSGAYDQIFITVRHLRVCWYEALSLTGGRVCRLQLLLVVASLVIFGSESRGTRDHILLSQIRDFPFHRLLRPVGLRWRYPTPPPHGIDWIKNQSQSQSYFTTGGLPPISSSWRQAPSDSHPDLFNWSLAVIDLM
jgi:hypothetical protein